MQLNKKEARNAQDPEQSGHGEIGYGMRRCNGYWLNYIVFKGLHKKDP